MRLGPNDRPILRELLAWGAGNFPHGRLTLGAEAIAARTGIHRNTVGRRMRALQEGGVIEGHLFEPHPHLVGLVRAGHHLEGIDIADTEAFARRLEPFPWISIAILHMDSCFLHTWHTDGAAVAADLAAVAEAFEAEQVVAAFRSDEWPTAPSARLTLSPLDRRILVALRRGKRRSVQGIADAVGTTRRTAARRIARLTEAGAGGVIPIFRPARIEGELIAIIEVPRRTPEGVAGLAGAFPDRIMGPVDAGPRVMVMVPFPAMDHAARRLAAAGEKKGLAGIEMRFMRDGWFPAACDAWLAAHVQNAPPDVEKR